MVAILPPESRQEDCINKHMTSICHPQEQQITDKDKHNQGEGERRKKASQANGTRQKIDVPIQTSDRRNFKSTQSEKIICKGNFTSI